MRNEVEALAAAFNRFEGTDCHGALTDLMASVLEGKGYKFEYGNPDDPEEYVWWFTWVSTSFSMSGVECGASHESRSGAVWEAFEHFMRDADIPEVDECPDDEDEDD